MNRTVMRLLAYIGSFGPIVLFLVVLAFILSRGLSTTGVVLLLAWKPIGVALNSILKWMINEPRPKGSVHLNRVERLLDKGTKGMPSGHAQLVGSEVAMTVCLRLPLWLRAYSVVQACVTLWQRYAYKKHTIMQLAAGLFVGVVYSAFYCSFLKDYVNA